MRQGFCDPEREGAGRTFQISVSSRVVGSAGVLGPISEGSSSLMGRDTFVLAGSLSMQIENGILQHKPDAR